MSAHIVDGRELARAVEARLIQQVEELGRDHPVSLVAVSVGAVGESDVYLRNQARACDRVGIAFRNDRLPAETNEDELRAHLDVLAADADVTGIILQLPLPDHLDARAMQDHLDRRKDVEGVHFQNLGRIAGGREGRVPCTARAAIHILEASNVPFEGAEAVVVGHSEIVGKPAALLLLDRLATVTVCHVATRDLAEHTRRADIVIVAVGKPDLVTRDMVRPGAAGVDVGINVVRSAEGRSKVVGDVSPDVAEVAGVLTPVPRGVGPVTVAMLLDNTVRASRIQHGLPADF